MQMKNSINAKCISKDVAPFLDGSKGAVHSVFSSAINLSFGDKIIVLLGKNRGSLPYSVLLEGEFALEYLGLKKDEFVIIDAKGIHTEKLFIDIESASEVDLNIVSSLKQLRKPQNFRRVLKRFAVQIQKFKNRDGLAVLLFDKRLPYHVEGDCRPNVWSGFLSERMGEFLFLLERVIRREEAFDADAFVEWGKNLAGCGPGLTPGSDDFITGVFAGLYGKGLSGEIPLRTADKICRYIAMGAVQKTTPISIQFLRQSGQERLFAEDVIKLVKAIYSGDCEAMKHAAKTVGSFGGTSGSDIMTGMYFTLSLGNAKD